MALEPFITFQDLPETLRDDFDNDINEANDVIARASRVVRGELLTARFAVSDGVATDPAVIQALKDATIAQVSWWSETGDVSGAGVQLGGGGIGSVRLPGGNSANIARDRQLARVAPEVSEILRECEAIEWNIHH